MEVVIQVRKKEELHLDEVDFESDSLGVVFVLQGLKEYEDWQAFETMDKGRVILGKHPLWNFHDSVIGVHTIWLNGHLTLIFVVM